MFGDSWSACLMPSNTAAASAAAATAGAPSTSSASSSSPASASSASYAPRQHHRSHQQQHHHHQLTSGTKRSSSGSQVCGRREPEPGTLARYVPNLASPAPRLTSNVAHAASVRKCPSCEVAVSAEIVQTHMCAHVCDSDQSVEAGGVLRNPRNQGLLLLLRRRFQIQ